MPDSTYQFFRRCKETGKSLPLPEESVRYIFYHTFTDIELAMEFLANGEEVHTLYATYRYSESPEVYPRRPLVEVGHHK
jgi:hypothetical protein